jgi:hypothetical protein
MFVVLLRELVMWGTKPESEIDVVMELLDQ